jgi:phosphotransferase system IIB component
MFSRVFNEYIALTKGDYTKYVFTCSNEDFILSLQEDMLAYSMATIPRTRKIVKNSKLVNTATIKQKKVSKPVHKDNYAVNIGNVDNDADDIDDDMAIDMSLLQDLKNELNANRTEKKNAKKQTDKKKNKKIEPDGESYVEPLDNVDLSEEEEVDDI